MAQCFVTTYRNHYRWQNPQKLASAKPEDKSVNAIPQEDIWRDGVSTTDDLDPDVWEKHLRKVYLKRFISTYQLAYSKDMVEKLIGRACTDSGFESQLMEYCNKLYHPQKRPKIVAPSTGSRRIFGYIRPSRNYTPLTDYQQSYGQTAFRVLRGDFKKTAEAPKVVQETRIAGDVPENAPQYICCCCRS